MKINTETISIIGIIIASIFATLGLLALPALGMWALPVGLLFEGCVLAYIVVTGCDPEKSEELKVMFRGLL